MMSPWATAGCSSRNSESLSLTALSTWPFTSELPSLLFVWPSNWGSRTLIERTQASPSRTSSPVSPSLSPLTNPRFRA